MPLSCVRTSARDRAPVPIRVPVADSVIERRCGAVEGRRLCDFKGIFSRGRLTGEEVLALRGGIRRAADC